MITRIFTKPIITSLRLMITLAVVVWLLGPNLPSLSHAGSLDRLWAGRIAAYNSIRGTVDTCRVKIETIELDPGPNGEPRLHLKVDSCGYKLPYGVDFVWRPDGGLAHELLGGPQVGRFSENTLQLNYLCWSLTLEAGSADLAMLTMRETCGDRYNSYPVIEGPLKRVW